MDVTTFKNSVLDFLKVTRESELAQLASSMAFTTILSVVPLLAFVIGVVNLIGGLPDLLGDFKMSILQYLATGAGDEILADLDKAMAKSESTLISVTGFILLAFSAIRLVNDIDLAIRKVWAAEPVKGRFIKKILTYAAVVFFILPGGAVLIGLVMSTSSGTAPAFVHSVLPILILALSVFLVYRFGPGFRISNKSAGIAALVATLALFLSQNIYLWTVNNLLDYNKIYGALAFLPLILSWVMIIWLIFLGGVALNRVLFEHETSTLRQKLGESTVQSHEQDEPLTDVMSDGEPSPAR